MYVVLWMTAAQNLWSNGLNEKHNGILGENGKEKSGDSRFSFEVAFTWAISTKNALHSVSEYSLNQHVFR